MNCVSVGTCLYVGVQTDHTCSCICTCLKHAGINGKMQGETCYTLCCVAIVDIIEHDAVMVCTMAAP